MPAAPTRSWASIACLSVLALSGCASLPSSGSGSVAALMPTLPADPVGSVLGSLGSLFGGPRVELDKLVQAQKWDDAQKLYGAHQKALDSSPEARASLGKLAAHLHAQAAPAHEALSAQLRPAQERPLSPDRYADIVKQHQQARDELQRLDQHPLLAQALWRPATRAGLEAALAQSQQTLQQSLPRQFVAYPHASGEFFEAYPLKLAATDAQALLRSQPELLRQAMQRGDAAQADLLMQRYAATHDDPAQRDTLILAWWSAQERSHGKKPSTLRQRIAVQQRLAAWLPGYEAKPRVGLLPLAASAIDPQHQAALAQRAEVLRGRFDARLLNAGTVAALEQALRTPEARELDLLILSVDSAPTSMHAKTDTGTQAGRFLSGRQTQNNPRYFELQQELMRARQRLIESKRAHQQAMQQARANMRGASNGIAALSALSVTAGVFAESSSQVDVNRLEVELAGTPPTTQRDVHQNYERPTLTYSQVTVVPTQLYVIDPASQRVAAFQGQQTSQGQLVQVADCHRSDSDCRAATPQELQQWLHGHVQQTLSRPPEQPASLEALLAALESPQGRPLADLKDWIEEGSQSAQRTIAQHQQDLDGRALRDMDPPQRQALAQQTRETSAPARTQCSDTQPYTVTLYNSPGTPGYVDFRLSADQMAAKMGGYDALLANLRFVADMENNTYGGPYTQQVQQQVRRAISAVLACQQELAPSGALRSSL